MLAIKNVDYEKIKAACIALNEVLEKPFQVVGAAKDVLVSQFVETVEQLSDEDKNGLPDPVIEFYNVLFADEAAGKTETQEATQEEAPPQKPEQTPEEDQGKEEEPGKEESGKEEEPEKPKKKVVGVRAYNDFTELSKIIGENNTPTGAIDKLTLAGGKLTDILEAFKEHITQGGVPYKGFKTVAAIKAHVAYREDRGWIYEREGADAEETIKHVGFKDPKAE